MKNVITQKGTKSSTEMARFPLSETKSKDSFSESKLSFEELYIQKDYKAAAQYLLKNKQHFDSGIFHYNLGTVYSKIGDYATARFLLEKSIKDGFINTSSLNNLNYVKEKLEVDDLSNSTSFPDQLVNISSVIPSSLYITFSLLLFLIIVMLIKLKKLISKWKIVLLLFLCLTPVLFSQMIVKEMNLAIVLKNVPVYEGPSKIFNEKGQLKAGSKILLGEFKDGWFYIEFPLSQVGWISKDQIGLY